MNGEQQTDIAARIEAAVRATAGVTGVYAAGTAVSKVIGAGARGLGVRRDDAPLVVVRQAAGGTRVDIALGVGLAAGATTTTRAVQRTVRDLLAAHGLPDAHVTVAVVHVTEPAPA
ncbi:hypothetical protein [Promicromonospora sukumoe]|uniref:hypothetical protein n=1 Tax=Promicromonospora sukumoe TaxID=88382 RepID=UPI000381987C|nr:hypothetical protein [Promicromonospora sukumoe]